MRGLIDRSIDRSVAVVHLPPPAAAAAGGSGSEQSGGGGSGSEQSGGSGQPQGDAVGGDGGGGGGGSPLQGMALASQALVLLLIFLLSSLGNSAVIAVIAKHRQLRTVTNAFIVSLSLSDLLAALLCLPFAFLTLFSRGGGGAGGAGGGGADAGGGGVWPFGDRLCVANGFFNSCSGIASALTMALISLDRYCAIARRPRGKIGRRRAARLLAGVWAAAALFSCPWYLLLRPRAQPEPQAQAQAQAQPRGFYHCTHLFHSASSRLGLSYGVALIALGHLLPFALMCFCHYHICQAARLSERRVRPLADTQAQAQAQARARSPPPPPPRLHGETRTATTVLVMIVFAICCRGPYCVAGIWAAAAAAASSSSAAEAEPSGGGGGGYDSASASVVDAVAAWMAWANGAINPLIYAARNPDICLLLGRARARGREGGYRTGNLAAYLPAEGPGQGRRGEGRSLGPGRRDRHKGRYRPERPGSWPSPGEGAAVWVCRNPALLFCRDAQRDAGAEPRGDTDTSV
ncbi:G-protein coupled receptor 135 [Callorhinchus milii]|uniref:G-protein coupled receptor 135 n=1 Tax=Callorhinchus milii TaxID=7868 RepID=UPI001C3F5D1D|nr:G-protein coupled receptor 135 [Callorhinchus milii]